MTRGRDPGADPPVTVAACQRHLGDRVVDDGGPGHDVASGWGAALSFGDRVRAMQVVGPARGGSCLTQNAGRASLDALQDYSKPA